jgi:hypothetical protein
VITQAATEDALGYPVFRCVFGLTIQATNGAFGLERKIDLPFVPHAGMTILGVFCEGCELKIKSFDYDLVSREFWVDTEDTEDEEWDRDFTMDDVRRFTNHGVLVDDHGDPEAWQADCLSREAKYGPPVRLGKGGSSDA